jgi:hypothetical protein
MGGDVPTPDAPPETPHVSDPSAGLTLGFLTVLHDATGYTGGYLVTNAWGRPLEFRLTTPVQPNRVQQILYGSTLADYIHADLIGKTLVERTSTPPALVITDTPAVLPLAHVIHLPVVCPGADGQTLEHERARVPLAYVRQIDRETIIRLLDRVDASVDLEEPFARIRDAVLEARKPGVLTRAAA